MCGAAGTLGAVPHAEHPIRSITFHRSVAFFPLGSGESLHIVYLNLFLSIPLNWRRRGGGWGRGITLKSISSPEAVFILQASFTPTRREPTANKPSPASAANMVEAIFDFYLK